MLVGVTVLVGVIVLVGVTVLVGVFVGVMGGCCRCVRSCLNNHAKASLLVCFFLQANSQMVDIFV